LDIGFIFTQTCIFVSGGCDMPSSVSGRILLKVWWIFVLVMLATYTGNLIAFLTVTKVNLPIASLSDLPKQSQLGYGTVKGSSLWSLLMVSFTCIILGIKGLQSLRQSDYADFALGINLPWHAQKGP
jgi:hypothetical protein